MQISLRGVWLFVFGVVLFFVLIVFGSFHFLCSLFCCIVTACLWRGVLWGVLFEGFFLLTQVIKLIFHETNAW